MTEKKKGSFFWPAVDTIEDAKGATKYGIVAAIVSSVLTGLAAAWSVGAKKAAFGMIDAWSFIDAAIFAGAAYGMYRESRFAAILGLLVFLLGKVYQFIITGKLEGAWMAIILVLCYVSAIRGVYALRKLRAVAKSV